MQKNLSPRSWEWWCTALDSVLGRQRQEHQIEKGKHSIVLLNKHGFKILHGYIKSCVYIYITQSKGT